MPEKIIIFSDGGARNNPGPAGIGAVIKNQDQSQTIAEISEYIGETTNNQAEYQAIYQALKKAKALGAKEVECYLDSQLVVRQLTGEYKVRNVEIGKIFVKVKSLSNDFTKIDFHHIKRANNKEADALVNKALDQHLLEIK